MLDFREDRVASTKFQKVETAADPESGLNYVIIKYLGGEAGDTPVNLIITPDGQHSVEQGSFRTIADAKVAAEIASHFATTTLQAIGLAREAAMKTLTPSSSYQMGVPMPEKASQGFGFVGFNS